MKEKHESLQFIVPPTIQLTFKILSIYLLVAFHGKENKDKITIRNIILLRKALVYKIWVVTIQIGVYQRQFYKSKIS